jgi:hypothetical protein
MNPEIPKIRAYDWLVRGEQEHAMASSSPHSLHRICIIMSPIGRFLQCRDCQLSYTFPDGVLFATLAKQFESHLCLPPIRGPDWRTDSRFIIVRYEGKVPKMASCARCERKFFTPSTFFRDAVGAEEYLGQKFDLHVCAGIEES